MSLDTPGTQNRNESLWYFWSRDEWFQDAMAMFLLYMGSLMVGIFLLILFGPVVF